MPMYFPNLKSVQRLAMDMAKHQKPENKYRGIIPKTEHDLDEARIQLGRYFRETWKDEIQALEVELGVSKDNYDALMSMAIISRFKGGGRP